MAFSIQCVNKGCGKIQEPYLDKETNKVHCSECDQEMKNVSTFTINQMKSMKQYKQKKVISFGVKCDKCNKEARPKLVKKEVVCGGCGKELENLSEPFKLMLKESLKTVDKDV